MMFSPKPVTIPGTVTAGSEIGHMITPLDGYYMEFMVILSHSGTHTFSAINNRNGLVYFTSTGNRQTILSWFDTQSQDPLPLVIQLSSGTATFDYQIMLKYNKITAQD